ncbi:hypothetical protein Q7P37_002576 [Cladosporium fusiforme]
MASLEELTARRIYKPSALRGNAVYVATDGACRDNGHSKAKSAYGVFFGPGHHLNKSAIISEPWPTNQRAELHAAISALEMFNKRRPRFLSSHYFTELIIRTDSAYLVNSMTKHINKWRWNGFKSARNLPVVNQDLFQKLDDLIFEVSEQIRGQVRFLRVPREQNQGADRLANQALDRAAFYRQ